MSKIWQNLLYSLFMADGYSWNYARGRDRNKLPGPEHLGWWAALALLLSIALHGLIFLMLERMEIVWSFQQAEEIRTDTVDFRQVEIRSMPEDMTLPPEDMVPVPQDSATLMEEIDFLDALPENLDIDISTEVDQASYALKMSQPDVGGQAPVEKMDPAAGVDIDVSMPEVGSETKILPPAEIGQVIIDSGATPGVKDGEGLAQEILKAGQGDGDQEGIASLEDLLKLPPNLLISKKTRLPSDLLFEFNSAELRESARLGLMKLALLMDRNPKLYCWIEGHTDLIGGDAYNLKLSKQRAEAVKAYLVESMRMDSERIIARGLGRQHPIVMSGEADVQAPNRRVEIKMRKTPPAEQAVAQPETEAIGKPSPPRAQPATPAQPVLVKPRRAKPVIPNNSPQAKVVTPENAPRARPVLPERPPRAGIIEE